MRNQTIIRLPVLICFIIIFLCCSASGAIKKKEQPIELIDSEDGILELQMDSPNKKKFQLLLENPPSAGKKEIMIRELELSSNVRTIVGEISTEKIILEPGMQERITVTFSDIPKGTYEGILTIRDSEDKWVMREFTIKLKAPFFTTKNFSDMKEIFILVFLGAITSIILTKALPISARKKQNKEKIAELNKDIKILTAYEPLLKNKFSVELHKAKNLNDNTMIYTPSEQARFNNIDAILSKLENQLKVRKDISRIYIDIDSRDFLPFSLEEKIRGKLKEADFKIYRDETGLAVKIKEEAEKLFEIKEKEYYEILRGKINDFMKHIEIEESFIKYKNFEIKDKNILSMIEALCGYGEKIKKKELLDREESRKCDMLWQKVDIYCNGFLGEKLRNNFPEEEDKILQLLESSQYEDMKMAVRHCDSMKQFRVTEKMIEKAIIENKVNIWYFPSDPDVNEWVSFRLEFDDEYINKSPLRDNFRYVWDFGDKTRNAEGIEVIHYFKRRGSLILLRKWVRRILSNTFTYFRKWKKFSVSVKMSKLGSSGFNSEIEPVPVQINESTEKVYRSGITFLDVFGFLLIFVISCFIAIITVYDDTYIFKSPRDILTPFLIGFGLDISRDGFLKTVTAKKGKG